MKKTKSKISQIDLFVGKKMLTLTGEEARALRGQLEFAFNDIEGKKWPHSEEFDSDRRYILGGSEDPAEAVRTNIYGVPFDMKETA